MAKSLKRKLENTSKHKAQYAANMAELAKDTLAEIRDLARGLTPVKMLDEGLMAALEELAHRTHTTVAGHTIVIEPLSQPLSSYHIERIKDKARTLPGLRGRDDIR